MYAAKKERERESERARGVFNSLKVSHVKIDRSKAISGSKASVSTIEA